MIRLPKLCCEGETVELAEGVAKLNLQDSSRVFSADMGEDDHCCGLGTWGSFDYYDLFLPNTSEAREFYHRLLTTSIKLLLKRSSYRCVQATLVKGTKREHIFVINAFKAAGFKKITEFKNHNTGRIIELLVYKRPVKRISKKLKFLVE